MSVSDRPKSVQHIPRARIYTRPGTANLWFSYLDARGELVRRSAGTDKRPDAWAALLRDYENQHELKFEDGVLLYFQKREQDLSPNTLRQYAFAVQAMRASFEGQLLKDITPPMVRSYIDQRRESVSDATVRRELAFLSSLFNFLIEEADQIQLDNPVRKVNKRKLKEQPRVRFLSHEEFDRLLSACHKPVHRRIIQTAVWSGMRHGELLDFQRSWIDWQRREIHLPAEVTKGEKARIIPISDNLEVILKEQCADTVCAHVFCYLDLRQKLYVPFTTFKNFFGAACKRAGLEDLHFHDLRHTFGSWWAQADGNMMVLKQIMGHSSIKTTERYAHINTSTAHRVRAQVERHSSDTVTRFLRHSARRKEDPH